jgi:hemolysin type calcium-binding protein
VNSPRLTRPGRLALCASAALLLLSGFAATAAHAGTVSTNLRVLTDTGRVLADVRQYTDTTTIKTNPQANCFHGAGGTGKTVSLFGANALGAAADAAQSVPALNPLLIDDEFAGSFGLGICGFGGVSSNDSNFWELRVDHKVASVAGDKAAVSTGDDVLWSLVPSAFDAEFNPISEPELSLQAPARAKPKAPFNVTVLEYSPTGFLKPAVGAQVTGAAAPADSQGHTKVTLTGSGQITATRAGAIPSRSLSVCARADIKKCPAKRGLPIFGSGRADRIGGTLGNDTIKARAGNDTISVRGRGRDVVDCGPGKDTVKADNTDKVRRGTCETIDRPAKGEKGS